ncbi:MAG TPA: CopG family antitoxin [bacterium]|jgi:predicted DNA binding CopG/RHH family protein|nr:CopG family antitoxin [bacterium]HQN73828.1 CopG family antitoxin [bacterium]
MRFDVEKDLRLQNERGISFEMIIEAISEGKVLDDIAHPKRENQRVMLVEVSGDVYFVPYVLEKDGNIFLKTAFINRKYRMKNSKEEEMSSKKKNDGSLIIKEPDFTYNSEESEEKELHDLYESGAFTPVTDERKKELAEDAKRTLAEMRAIKSITLRINSDILEMIRRKADAERIPYQTLMQLVLSQFAQGKIKIQI